jgi:hypothetical protein
VSSADVENETAGKLIERLLVDPEFRAEFRRDPATACALAGLPDLAAELAGSAKSMDTLTVRESRSSLAGVVMAVAVEGMSVAEAHALMQHGLSGAPRGAKSLLHGRIPHSPLARVHHAGTPAALERELRSVGRGREGGGGTSGSVAGGGGGSAAGGAGGPEPAGGGASAASGAGGGASVAGAAGGGAAAASAGGGGAVAANAGGAGAAAPAVHAPVAAPVPAAPAVHAPVAAAVPAAPAPPDPGAQPAHGGVSPVWPDQPSGGAGGTTSAGTAGAVGAGTVVDGAGTGGGLTDPNALMELLQSPRLSAPANVRAFLTAGGGDPRMVSVLNSALANHTIGLGQVEAITDPAHVQAVDIVSVDGQPVGADNLAARDLVTEIAALDPSVRPSEIGTPWPIRSPGFFSDPGAADRLHLAFEAPGTNTPPVGAGAYAAPAGGQLPAGEVPAGQVPGAQVPGGQAATGQAPGTLAGTPPAVSPLSSAATTPPAVAPLSSVAPAPVAASTPGSGVDAALAYARAMIGKLPESAGSNLGPQLDKFEADFGFHGAPWCGIFAGHVLEAAGLKPPHTVAAVASILDLARNGDPPFVKGILPVSEARPGDLVTFGGTEHVAVVVKVDSAGVHTVAGNTSQSNVSETTYSPSSVTGVVRPDYAAGKPGSIRGVWDYAGVQPPAAEPQGVIAAPAAPAAAPPPAAPGDFAAPAAPAAAPPVNAAVPMPGTPAPQTSPIAFNAPASRGPGRNTVQFLPAVQPSPGSPLFGQTPAAGGPIQPPLAADPVQAGAAPQATAGVVGQPPATAGVAAPQSSGAVLEQAASSAAPGGSISVSSSLLTPGQEKFAGRLAELTGLDPRVVAAWELAEESGSAAQGREAASNFNWLNIGYFDSGAGKIAFDKEFGDPISAAEQSAKFLKGEWGGASSSIRAILNSVGHSPADQMSAIANSDWASSHYGGGANLRGTYNELGDIHIENTGTT